MAGKKTYLVAVLFGLASAAQYLGWLDDNLYAALSGLLAGSGLAALRAGIAKIE